MHLLNFNRNQWKALISGGILLLLLIIYGLGILFYQGHFLPNTTAAGISVANQNIENANKKIQSNLSETAIMFSENQQAIGNIALKDLGIQVKLTDKLSDQLSKQSPKAWPLALLGINQTHLSATSTEVTFDDGIINDLIPSLGVNNNERNSSKDAYILDDNDQFSIVQEEYGQQITGETIKNAMITALNNKETDLDISTAYVQPKLKKESSELIAGLEKIKLMESTKLTLAFNGNEVTIPQEKIASWIFINEEGKPQLDRDLVEEYVRELNTEYSGLFNTRQFMSTYQGEVTIQPGTYGWYIDRHSEPDAIIADVEQGANLTREPAIGGDGYGMGDSIGNSYVEVDIANQMMMVYIDGVLMLETPVVTGKTGTYTVPGAYKVWNMESPSVLVGYNPHTEKEYEQPVQFWIAFDDQAQGIHDANWQSSFGGASYLENGSLGCVNTPPGVMASVFSLVYYGMPVIIF